MFKKTLAHSLSSWRESSPLVASNSSTSETAGLDQASEKSISLNV